MLTTVGRDANNQIYPIAWVVVNVENTDTWKWFIQKLKMDLKLGNGDGITLISDRQKVTDWWLKYDDCLSIVCGSLNMIIV